jgi:hypothetical protein
MAEELAKRLQAIFPTESSTDPAEGGGTIEVQVTHRDLGRE